MTKKTAVRKVMLMEKLINYDTHHEYVQANEFVTARYSKKMSVIGQKIMRLAISNCDSMHDGHFYAYEISLSELAKVLDLRKDNIYRDVKTGLSGMAETVIYIDQDRKNGSYKRLPLFQECSYNDGRGTVTIEFSPKMTPFFLQVKESFTKIRLEDIIFMHHKYSIRTYELIKMHLGKQRKEVYADKHTTISLSIDEYRKATGTENNFRQIGQLKKFVINPAVDDIQEHTGYHFEITYRKEGKKVTGMDIEVWSRSGWLKKKNPGQINIYDMGEDDSF